MEIYMSRQTKALLVASVALLLSGCLTAAKERVIDAKYDAAFEKHCYYESLDGSRKVDAQCRMLLAYNRAYEKEWYNSPIRRFMQNYLGWGGGGGTGANVVYVW